MGRWPSDELNLKQVAAALGVHYMTAYRYVRTGRLPARRVDTGWVVERQDLAVFSQQLRNSGADARPRSPGATEDRASADGWRAGSSREARWRERLRWTLAKGDEVAAWQVLEQALTAGCRPADCYLDLLVGAIDDLSGRSRLPEAPVAEEYLAMATAARLVARLGARFRRPGRSRGTVVFGAPLGEHHTLAISVVADLVRLEGFSCLELGANVPPEAFAGAASDAYRLVAVGVGLAQMSNVESARRAVTAVHQVDAAIPVIIGGQSASPTVQELTGADAWAADGRSAVSVLSELARWRRGLWVMADRQGGDPGGDPGDHRGETFSGSRSLL